MLGKSEQYLKDLELLVTLLSVWQKPAARTKVTQLRQRYEGLRVNFFKLEDEQLRQVMGNSDLS